jgi:hypothetical protein
MRREQIYELRFGGGVRSVASPFENEVTSVEVLEEII